MVLVTVGFMATCEFYNGLKLHCSSLSVVFKKCGTICHTRTHTHSSEFMASIIKLILCYEFPDPLNLSAHIKVLLAREKEMEEEDNPREG